MVQVEPLGEISSRKMFGGYGIFATGKMFALVSSGTLAMGLVADLVLTPAVVLFWAKHLRS